jgi:hypothetical protein
MIAAPALAQEAPGGAVPVRPKIGFNRWQEDWSVRFESNHAPSFGVGESTGDDYLLDRAQIHADIRPDANWQIFLQLEDVRAPWKDVITANLAAALEAVHYHVGDVIRRAGGHDVDYLEIELKIGF